MESFEIGPASDPDRWQFTSEKGTVILPENGVLPLDGADNTVICKTDVKESAAEKSLLVITANSSDCVFLQNGRVIYSPSGRYAEGKFDSSEYKKTSASGQLRIDLTESSQLTMIVQFTGGENRLSRMPKLTLYPDTINYLSQFTGPIAGDALPAGVYFAAAVLLLGLFLLGLWKKRSDPGLIILAFCALSVAFGHTASYSYGVIELVRSPTATWFCTILPQTAMIWMLWYRLSKKCRIVFLAVSGLTTAAALTLFFIGLDNLNWVRQMNLMTTWIIPASVLILLTAAAIDAAKGNPVLRRLFRYMLFSIPVIALAWVFSAIVKGKLSEDLCAAFTSLAGKTPTLYYIVGYLCIWLLLLCFIQAVLELIGAMARRDADLKEITLRERYAAENLEILRQSQEETRRQRHEMQHHLALLDEMLSKKEDARASGYVRSLLAKADALPSGNYCDNMIINAIAGHYLNLAKAEKVTVKAEIRAVSSLPVKDEDLCILLTNLLENALEACRNIGTERERDISLRISANEDHIMIDCENSTDKDIKIMSDGTIPTSKSDPDNHGYGVSAVAGIAQKYCGEFEITCGDGRFRAVVTI
ncbi:MAG: GHKL domain-containing protein [Clostridia bacterium]|nr:GHKL domain-containing protein [Clostridia bacterium]